MVARLSRWAEGPSNSHGCSWNPVRASNQGLLGLADCTALGFASSLRCASLNQLTAAPLGIMGHLFQQLGLELLHKYLLSMNFLAKPSQVFSLWSSMSPLCLFHQDNESLKADGPSRLLRLINQLTDDNRPCRSPDIVEKFAGSSAYLKERRPARNLSQPFGFRDTEGLLCNFR